MTKDTALKRAIEALDTLMMEKDSIYQQALEACKEALEQPKEPQYLYVWSTEIGIALTEPKDKVLSGYEYIGKIKLEVDDANQA